MSVSVEVMRKASKQSKTERARQWLTKGAVPRDDSDDELGVEDHPWRWIYDGSKANGRSASRMESLDSEQDVESTPTRKRKASSMLEASSVRQIIGATMGSFSCQIGDTVLLKSPEAGKDWAGIIWGFSDVNKEDDEEMSANIMWFQSPDEFVPSKKSMRRTDSLPNEQYIAPDFDLNPLVSINGKARIMSKEAFYQLYPGGTQPKGKAAAAEYRKCIICRRGIRQRTSKYTEEFIWEDIYQGPKDLLTLLDRIQRETKRTNRPKQDVDPTEELDYIDEEEKTPKTPRKRQKTTTALTPKSSRKSNKFTTPTHKRIVIKKPLEFTPLGTRILSESQSLSSPYHHARSHLHVAAVPTSLPCREDEFSTVYTHLSAAISDGSGACIYISGTPGTGKTATVREVVAQLNESVLADELDDFVFVEINGMKVTDPHQSYSLLWEALKGDRVSPSHALDLLEREFSLPSPRRVPCVVLMDELDQLVTKNQSVMYNFFNWPVLRHSRLIVLAVANTMDLPERTLSNKISSRLGLTRITFPGYNHTQLMAIITARLEGVPGKIVDPDAVQFAARKVAAVSGDTRRALDICRRAVELAEQAQETADAEMKGLPATPSKKSATTKKDNKTAVEDLSAKPLARVTIATIKQAINETTSSPLSQHLRSLPLSSKLFLAALLARVHRTGVAESTLGDVVSEAKRIADLADNSQIHDFLLLSDGTKGEKLAAPRVLAMGGAAMELVAAGILGMDSRGRGERTGKVGLRVGEDEVRSALGNDAEVKGLGFSA